MKKTILLLFLVCSIIAACSGNQSSNESKQPAGQMKDCLEVLYFHSKQRCITCRAIEQHTTELLNSKFKKEMENGEIVYRTIDISEEENISIAEKYEVTWSSLILVKWKGGKEEVVNMTDFAFSNAKSSPEEFKKGLTEQIEKMTKE